MARGAAVGELVGLDAPGEQVQVVLGGEADRAVDLVRVHRHAAQRVVRVGERGGHRELVVGTLVVLFVAQEKGLLTVAALYALSGPAYWAWGKFSRKAAA